MLITFSLISAIFIISMVFSMLCWSFVIGELCRMSTSRVKQEGRSSIVAMAWNSDSSNEKQPGFYSMCTSYSFSMSSSEL